MCWRCHRDKPFLDHLATFVEWRLAVIIWALHRPRVQWWDPEDIAWAKDFRRLIVDERRSA